MPSSSKTPCNWVPPVAINVRTVQEANTVDHHALLVRGLALQHPRSISGAHVLLDHRISGARWQVIAIGPDRGARIVRKKRPIEFVTVIATHWIGSGADGVTHRIRRVGLV